MIDPRTGKKLSERRKGAPPQYDDLPALPSTQPPATPAPLSLPAQAGGAYRRGQERVAGAIQDVVKGVTRPFVEPFLRSGPEVVGQVAGGIKDFASAAAGVAPAIPSPIAGAEARPRTTPPAPQKPPLAPQKPTTPGTQSRLQTPKGRVAPNPLYTNLPGPAATAALDSTDPGTAVISGRFAGSALPETRSYTKAGVTDAGKRLNVVPGLFSGVSRETEQALAEARNAASARGDFEAVERSFLTTPEQRAEYDAGKAEERILKRLPTLPAPKLGDALQGVTDLRTARNGKVPTLDQVKAARATQLLTGNPGDVTATDQVLFGKTPPETQRRIVEDAVLGEDGFPTGAKRFFSVDPATGQAMPVELPGAKSAQGGGRPADYPDAYQGLTPDGKPGWFVKREGKTYLVSE